MSRSLRLVSKKATLGGPLVGIAINHLRYQSGQNLLGFVLIVFHVFFPPFKIYARLSKNTAIATPVVIPFDSSCCPNMLESQTTDDSTTTRILALLLMTQNSLVDKGNDEALKGASLNTRTI